MSLDITKIASQISEMAGKLKSINLERRSHIDLAMGKLSDKSIDIAKLK
jgi:hypothetical protein